MGSGPSYAKIKMASMYIDTMEMVVKREVDALML